MCKTKSVLFHEAYNLTRNREVWSEAGKGAGRRRGGVAREFVDVITLP